MFNSASICLIGDKSLTVPLRVLTAIELYTNADFYANHPQLGRAERVSQGYLTKSKTAFTLTVSDEAFSSCFCHEKNNKADCIRKEAMVICSLKEFASFVCMMALSSVLNIDIYSHYPSVGMPVLENYFNCKLSPRISQQADNEIPIHLLWSKHFDVSGRFIRTIHVVPLVATTKFDECDQLMQSVKLYPSVTSFLKSIKIEDDQDSEVNQVTSQIKKRKLNDIGHNSESSSQLKDRSDTENTPQSTHWTPAECSMHLGPEGKEKSRRGLPIYSRDEVDKYDIGLHYMNSRSMNDNEIYELIQNVWKPSPTFRFPITIEAQSRKRCFQYNYLQQYSWLAYSKYLDACFCLPCVLFLHKTESVQSSRLIRLYTEPFIHWTMAASRLRDHDEKSNNHKDATALFLHFMKDMNRKSAPIQQKRKEEKAKFEANKEKLKPIFETVLFCGRQNIPLQGYAEYTKLEDVSSTQDSYSECDNLGNLVALLKFRIDNGDKALKAHFPRGFKNTAYGTKEVQSALLNCCGEYLRESLINEVKSATIFSILVQEFEDLKRNSEIPLLLRFVDSKGEIREDFIKFIPYEEGDTSFIISELIEKEINALGLNMENCRGQAYPEIGNLAGKYQKAASQIQKSYSNASYVHCIGHRLNMSILNSCNMLFVRSMIHNVRSICNYFFASPRRQECLEANIKNFVPKEQQKHLLDVCRTHWVDEINCLSLFQGMYGPILLSLEEIKNDTEWNWDRDSTYKANTLFLLCSEFEFVISLVVAKHLTDYTNPATRKFQYEANDIIKGYEQVELLKHTVETLKANVDEYHETWFEEAKRLANFVGVEPEVPRGYKQCSENSKFSAENTSEYYKVRLTIPLIDHLITQLPIRFSEVSIKIVKGFVVIPKLLQEKLASSGRASWNADFLEFASLYQNYFPEFNSIKSEMDIWESYWTKTFVGVVPEGIEETLKAAFDMKLTLPNIYHAIQILGTIPLTCCKSESSVSSKKNLEDYMRSIPGGSVEHKRDNGFATLHAHQSIPVNIDDVINKFLKKYPNLVKMLKLFQVN